MARTLPLVVVPGLACTAALYAPQLPALATGRPVMVAEHTGADAMAAIAADILAAAPDRFALAGLSMGGYVAFEMWRQAPGRIARLALLDTQARADTPEASDNRRRLMALAAAGRLDEIHAALWPRLVSAERQGEPALEAIVRGMLLATGAAAFGRQQTAILGRVDSRPTLATIDVPTLVLVGEADALTPPELAREVAAGIAGAELVVVPRSGHLSTLEQPELVTAALERWLAP